MSIGNISVSLSTSGGYNGDIYVYLRHIAYQPNANSAVRGSGMNLTFVTGTGNPIPTGGSGVLSGSYYTGYSDLAVLTTRIQTVPGRSFLRIVRRETHQR